MTDLSRQNEMKSTGAMDQADVDAMIAAGQSGSNDEIRDAINADSGIPTE